MSAAAVRDSDTRRVRQRQLLLFSGLAAGLLILFALWLTASSDKAPAPAPRIDAELADPGTAEESWTRRSEARIGVVERRVREMEAESRRLVQENDQLRAQLQKNANDARHVIDRQAAMIEDFERKQRTAPATTAPNANLFVPGSAGRASTRSEPAAGDMLGTTPLIRNFELEKAPAEQTRGDAARPLSYWLPAGSHAEAVVLAGVDASAGVASQGDPRPVLLRITGPAWTAAADGKAESVDLAGCTIVASAHGDLSSEKVYARLRTLTCAGETPGTVIETEVAGFVAGAGKAGVRGPVVSREGALVEKAFLAGLVSGAGQSVSTAFQPQAVASGGTAAVANTGLADIGRAGLGAGAGTAGRKVADYLIRRAEQYQPVIQLQAGTPVTVVFIEGARLDGQTDDPKETRQ